MNDWRSLSPRPTLVCLLIFMYVCVCVCTAWTCVMQLSMDDVLDADKLHEILQAGHSRVPCYRGTSRNNIQGVLLTKRLIVCRPEERDRVSKYADFKVQPTHSTMPCLSTWALPQHTTC